MKRRSASALAAALTVAIVILLVPRGAVAGDMAGAEALFREGRALWVAGDHAAACVKFTESERLDPSPGALLNLGKCYEDDGRVATAWAQFVSASELATARGDLVQAAEAKQRAAELSARLPRLTIDMDAPPPGLVVHRDDVELARGSLGSSLPVDPGSHRIVAKAPGFIMISLETTLAEGEARKIVIPPLVREKVVPVTPKPGRLPEPKPESGTSHDAVLGWVVGGSGVAFAATSGVLFALAVSDDHNAQKGCAYAGHWACSPASLAAARERDTLSTIATISGSVGVVGIGVGLWFLLHPTHVSSAGARAGAREPFLLPELTPHGTALYLRESFE